MGFLSAMLGLFSSSDVERSRDNGYDEATNDLRTILRAIQPELTVTIGTRAADAVTALEQQITSFQAAAKSWRTEADRLNDRADEADDKAAKLVKQSDNLSDAMHRLGLDPKPNTGGGNGEAEKAKTQTV